MTEAALTPYTAPVRVVCGCRSGGVVDGVLLI